MNRLLLTAMLSAGFAVPAFAQTGADTEVPLEESESILDAKSYVDTYDPTAGPYGGTNVYAAPTFTTGNVTPNFTAPSGLTTVLADCDYTGSKKTAAFTLSQSLVCDNFNVAVWSELVIDGDVTLIVNNSFTVQNQSKITLADGASLTIYCYGEFLVQDQCLVNPDTTRPGDLRVYQLGESPVRIEDQSSLVGNVYAPDADLQVSNGSDFYGGLMAKSLTVQNIAAAHFTSIAGSVTTVDPQYD